MGGRTSPVHPPVRRSSVAGKRAVESVEQDFNRRQDQHLRLGIHITHPDLGHLAYADYLRWAELSCAEMIMGIPDTLDEAEAVGALNRVARQAIDCLDRLLAGRVEIGGFGGTHGCLGTG